MKADLEFFKMRLSCAYFFMAVLLVYGIFTSRLPALRSQTDTNDAQIGLILLGFGGSCLIGLVASRKILSKVNVLKTLRTAVLLSSLFLVAMTLSRDFYFFALFAVLTGFCLGITEVAMNTQGAILEKYFNRPCMGFFHAFGSLGGVLGSVSGSLFAACDLSSFENSLCMVGIYMLFLPLFSKSLNSFEGIMPAQKPRAKTVIFDSGIALFPLIVLGLFSFLAYALEGFVAEWGSLLMHDEKSAPETVAALVYAVFSSVTALSRIILDNLRLKLGDFSIVCGGAFLAIWGMFIVLHSSFYAWCFIGYVLVGIGLSPLVPIIFSRAASLSKTSPERVISLVALPTYAGMMFCPPLIGFLAHDIGLNAALHVSFAALLVLFLGSVYFKGKRI